MPHFIIAGSTGLIGQAIAQQLASVDAQVTLLARREIPTFSANQQLMMTDFKQLSFPKSTSNDDTLFCALGTTIKTAGSKQEFEAVDLHLVVSVAKAAKAAGIKRLVVVSSTGTSAKARGFYLQTKARMEAALIEIGFEHLVILRPSLLLGERNEFRLAERIGEVISKALKPLFIGKLRRFRPVQARAVAAKMIALASSESKVRIVESEEI